MDKKRDYDLLKAILGIHSIAEELEKLSGYGELVDSQKVKALGNALGKVVGDLLNIMSGLKSRGEKISPQVLSGMQEQILEFAESAEAIMNEARKCRFCGSAVEPLAPARDKRCWHCAGMNAASATVCEKCGNSFE
jgi:NADH pyrophosphatase NudC (nudix superfamily)